MRRAMTRHPPPMSRPHSNWSSKSTFATSSDPPRSTGGSASRRSKTRAALSPWRGTGINSFSPSSPSCRRPGPASAPTCVSWYRTWNAAGRSPTRSGRASWPRSATAITASATSSSPTRTASVSASAAGCPARRAERRAAALAALLALHLHAPARNETVDPVEIDDQGHAFALAIGVLLGLRRVLIHRVAHGVAAVEVAAPLEVEHHARLRVAVQQGEARVVRQRPLQAALRVAHPDRQLVTAVDLRAAAEREVRLPRLVHVGDDHGVAGDEGAVDGLAHVVADLDRCRNLGAGH